MVGQRKFRWMKTDTRMLVESAFSIRILSGNSGGLQGCKGEVGILGPGPGVLLVAIPSRYGSRQN